MKNHDAIFQYVVVGALTICILALCIFGKSLDAAPLAVVSTGVGVFAALLKQNQKETPAKKPGKIIDVTSISQKEGETDAAT